MAADKPRPLLQNSLVGHFRTILTNQKGADKNWAKIPKTKCLKLNVIKSVIDK